MPVYSRNSGITISIGRRSRVMSVTCASVPLPSFWLLPFDDDHL